MTIERRAWAEPVEFRSEGGRLVASGIAIRYGAVSKDLGGFVERILPGAAKKTLKEQDVVALHEHDTRMLLGRMSSGTLRLFDSKDALRYEVDLPDTTVGRDVAHLLERGDIKGSSFGFRAIASRTKWEEAEDGMALRTVGEIVLRDVSTTCMPAYEQSSAEVALRSLAEQTGHDLSQVLEAAQEHRLPELISEEPAASEERQDEGQDDGRETTVIVPPRITWLYS